MVFRPFFVTQSAFDLVLTVQVHFGIGISEARYIEKQWIAPNQNGDRRMGYFRLTINRLVATFLSVANTIQYKPSAKLLASKVRVLSPKGRGDLHIKRPCASYKASVASESKPSTQTDTSVCAGLGLKSKYRVCTGRVSEIRAVIGVSSASAAGSA